MIVNGTEDAISRCMICPVCQGSKIEYLFRAVDRNQNASGEFPFMACESCGTWFQSMRRDGSESITHYPLSYQSTASTNQGNLVRLEAALKKLKRLHRFRDPGGSLLDVGCKSGEFVKVARDHGWDAIGIELLSGAAEIGTKAYDVKIIVGDFLDTALPAESTDVVTLWHVFEHFSTPLRTLSKAVDILAPNGMLVIATPNPSSAQAKIFRRRWFHLDSPRHLTLVPPKALVVRLEDMGMKVIGLNFVVPEHNWAGIFSSLVNPQFIRPGKLLPRAADNALKNALRYAIVSPFEILARVESMFLRGGTYEVFAVKTT